MNGRVVSVWLWVLVAMLAACKRDDAVRETAAEVEVLADAIVVAVRQAETPAEGVAAAQALLDARASALTSRMDEVRALRSSQVSDEVRVELGRTLTRALMKVRAVEADLIADTLRDDALRQALDRLVADFQAIVGL